MNSNIPRTTKTIAIWLAIGMMGIATRFVFAQAQNAPPPPQGNSQHHNVPAPATRPLSPLGPGEERLSIQFSGGHDTDPRDHGRPVTLIAAALNVPADVFRQTFTHVHPAGPGSGGPTDAEARQNKSALLAGLSPYGITDDRINSVSNFYRYMKRNPEDLWQHRDAIAFAVVKNNKIVRFDLADSGAGYTTPPSVEIHTLPDVKLSVKLLFGTDMPTNGSIKSLSLDPPNNKKLP